MVTFSGDKMLGGPQAGLIIGRRDAIARISKNPINRAVRIDKMTLAALEATLRLYRDPDAVTEHIPTLAMLTARPDQLKSRARRLAGKLKALDPDLVKTIVRPDSSRVGGGSLPLQQLPTFLVGIRLTGWSAARLERKLRLGEPPIIGRVEDDWFWCDPRTMIKGDVALVAAAVSGLLPAAAAGEVGV